MCGICGFISNRKINYNQLSMMNDMMFHRGPNDSGVELFSLGDGYSLGLAHRRLSIMDLSMLGHQPMHSIDNRISLVFNGEIYNFLQIREELYDYPFKSHSDTEVIIAAYLKWGISCINKFNGMFAIALYDREIDTLYLVRDRMGKKPLYYWLDERGIVFASELKPIIDCPFFKKNIRREIIPKFLYHQYINAPDTIFESVYKLEPGRCLEFKKGTYTVWKYWDIVTDYHKEKGGWCGSFREAKLEFKNLLEQAVKIRMISDVPLGAFLSGGYDSSLVTAVAQSLSSRPIRTFSIGFNDIKYNESEFACKVANYLGTNHTNLIIDESEMLELVDSIPEYYDEPFADSSQIPSMLVAKLAKNDVTVALTGDGGDELFCGYNLYELVRIAKKYDSIGAAIMYLKEKLPVFNDIYDRLPLTVQVISENRCGETKTQFGVKKYYEMCNRMVLGDAKAKIKYEMEQKYRECNWQITRMLLDMETYLPGDILCKVDRATMKYSLEARCPLLDKNIINFSFRLPHSYKYSEKNGKKILKELAYDYIPKDLLDRPKSGFAVPLDKWLRGPLKSQVLEYSDEKLLKDQELFDWEYVNNIINVYMRMGDSGRNDGNNYSKFIWSFLVFQKWYEKYIA